MSRRKLIFIISVAFVLIVLGGWEWTYPSDSDPKSLGYLLWKAGLYKMNLTTATGIMVGDSGSKKLIVGKTIPELERRFGTLLTPSGTSQYNRGCYQDSYWKDNKVLFIRNSPWMLVFDGDKASDLVLMKGC